MSDTTKPVELMTVCSRLDPHTGKFDHFDAAWLSAARWCANSDEAAGHPIPVSDSDPCVYPRRCVGHIRGVDVVVDASGRPMLVGVFTPVDGYELPDPAQWHVEVMIGEARILGVAVSPCIEMMPWWLPANRRYPQTEVK